MVLKLIVNNVKLLVSLGVVLGGIIYQNELKKYCNTLFNASDIEGVLTDKTLGEYDGIIRNRLYLAVLGVVFDVTNGKKHYEKGAGYNYFVGKDGSRALVTGDFKDESKHKDHVLDLSCNDLFTLLHWRDTFIKKYEEVGVLIGRFYNQKGEPTAYSTELNYKIEQCELEKEMSRKEELKYPSCNMAWSADEGTKVWCTKSSGGISRSWTGVPRLLYTPGVERPRCVCVNTIEKDLSSLLKEYDKCPNTSTTCYVIQ